MSGVDDTWLRENGDILGLRRNRGADVKDRRSRKRPAATAQIQSCEGPARRSAPLDALHYAALRATFAGNKWEGNERMGGSAVWLKAVRVVVVLVALRRQP